MTAYDPRDWFWIVGDDVTRAWSSAAGGYVSVWDQSRTTRIASEEELSEVLRPYGLDVPVVTRFDVNAERDRRMVTLAFAGKAYDLRDQSLSNVSGAGMLALAAIISGAAPGHLRWADPGEDFTWIANDNTATPMDAQTCWAFAQAAAAWRKHCIFRARALKDMTPIPHDYKDGRYWE